MTKLLLVVFHLLVFLGCSSNIHQPVRLKSELQNSLEVNQFEQKRKLISLDPATGLMWQKQPDTIVRNWDDATNYCRNLNLGGYSDWVLPENDAFEDMFGKKDLLDPFKKPMSFWSSTTYSKNSSLASYVPFPNGYEDYSNKTSRYYSICVRGGKWIDYLNKTETLKDL